VGTALARTLGTPRGLWAVAEHSDCGVVCLPLALGVRLGSGGREELAAFMPQPLPSPQGGRGEWHRHQARWPRRVWTEGWTWGVAGSGSLLALESWGVAGLGSLLALGTWGAAGLSSLLALGTCAGCEGKAHLERSASLGTSKGPDMDGQV